MYNSNATTPPAFRTLSAPVIGWAMYDFANTMFSFAVITRYFNEWVIDQEHHPDWQVGLMGFIVGIILVVAMPAMGAVSDQVGRRKPFLAVFTATCIAATAALGVVPSIPVALVVAALAIFAYQLALSMYDPLLATIAPPEHRGKVSGLGVGLGYIGALVAAGVLLQVVPKHDFQEAFIPTALMFAVSAIPIFAFVREPARAPKGDATRRSVLLVVHEALTQVVSTIGHIRRDHGDVGRFLIARFLYVDAIATVLTYMTVYMSRVGDFSEGSKTLILAIAMIAAAIGAFIAGALVEARGPRFVLISILTLAATTLVLAAGTGSPTLIWVLGPMVGITLGGVWTSDRVFMMRLAPPEFRGEFFGVYNLVGKLSSGIGPLVLWGGTIWALHSHASWSLLSASRAALVMLALAVLAGLFVLRPLSDAARFDETWERA